MLEHKRIVLTAVNAFIKRGAQAFKNVPYEELYDLENDPYEHRNLASSFLVFF